MRVKETMSVLIVLGMLLAGCGAPEQVPTDVVPQPTAQVIIETVIVEGTPVVREATVVVEKVITATPEPAAPPSTDEQPVYGGTIKIGFGGTDIPSWDPARQWNQTSWAAQLHVYNGLYRFKYGTTEVEPELASALPELSEDGLTVKVSLREDIQFSNGDPLTCKDVKYTWDRMLDDATQGYGVTYYLGVKGAKEAFAGEADGVSGVTCLDDQTVQFELLEPIGYFDKLLAMPWTYVMNQAHVEAVGEDIARQPLGAGPYRLAEWDEAVRVVLEKNPNYFRLDEPYADRVVFEFNVDAEVGALSIETGDLDFYADYLDPLEYQRLKDDPAYKGETFEVAWPDTWMLNLNSSKEPFNDIRVRQAIAHCIDRDVIIRAAIGGFGSPANTIITESFPESYNADQPIYEHDVAKAKSLLAEAGYPDGFTFESKTRNATPWDKFGPVVQAQLAECGITMDLQLVDKAAQQEWQRSADSTISYIHWPFEIPDPFYPMDGGFTAAAMYPSCCNWSWYTTTEMEQMLADARTETDPVNRGEMYQAIDQLVSYDQALWIPVWHPVRYWAVSEDLAGFRPPVVLGPQIVEANHYWKRSGQ